jgi:methionine synthase II (cobalamin-independent)
MMNATTAIDLRSMRVDLVGSLLRPQTLKDAFAKYGEGSAYEVDLKDAVRRLLPNSIDKGFRASGVYRPTLGTARI